MPEQPLPANWAEEVDAKGRCFYINHIAQTTQWERPTLDEPPHPPEMLPGRHRPSPQQAQQVSRRRASRIAETCTWTPRVTYWVAATMSLPVWILSALAASGNDWFDDEQLFAFDEDIIDQCGDDSVSGATEAFCKIYIPFMAMQLASTSLASLALVLLSMAALVPASDGCCSVKPLGALGGYAVAVSALFQLVAIALILQIARSNTAYLSDDSEDYNDLGPTFWVAIVSFTVAMFDAIFLFNFVSSAGDGFIYDFIRKIMTARG